MKPIVIKQKSGKGNTISTYRITDSDFVGIEVNGPQGKTSYNINYNFLSRSLGRSSKRNLPWMILALISLAAGSGLYLWRPQGLPVVLESYFIELMAGSIGLFITGLILYWFHKTCHLVFYARYSHIPLIVIRPQKKNPENSDFLKELYKRIKEANQHDDWHQSELLIAELSGLRFLQESGAIMVKQYKIAKQRLMEAHSEVSEEGNKGKKRKLRLSSAA